MKTPEEFAFSVHMTFSLSSAGFADMILELEDKITARDAEVAAEARRKALSEVVPDRHEFGSNGDCRWCGGWMDAFWETLQCSKHAASIRALAGPARGEGT